MVNYSPSWLVRAGYHIPHLTPQLTESSLVFEDIKYQREEYLQSISIFPFIIMLIGIIILVVCLFLWIFKYFYGPCCLKSSVSQPNHEIFFHLMAKANPILMLLFFIFVSLGAIANCCVLISEVYLGTSVVQFVSAMDGLNEVFLNIQSIGISLVDIGVQINTTVNSPACAAFQTGFGSTTPTVNDFIYYSQQLVYAVGNVPNSIDDAKINFTYYAEVLFIVMYVYLSVICVSICLLVSTTCCKNEVLLHCSIGFMELIMLTLVLVAGVELALVVCRYIVERC